MASQASLPAGYDVSTQGAPLEVRLLGDGCGNKDGATHVPLLLERENATAEGSGAGERLHFAFSLSPCMLGVQGEAAEGGVVVGAERRLELRVSPGAVTAGGVLGTVLQFEMLDATLGEEQLGQTVSVSLNAAHRRHYVLPEAAQLSQLNVTVTQLSHVAEVPLQAHPHPAPLPRIPTPHPIPRTPTPHPYLAPHSPHPYPAPLPRTPYPAPPPPHGAVRACEHHLQRQGSEVGVQGRGAG